MGCGFSGRSIASRIATRWGRSKGTDQEGGVAGAGSWQADAPEQVRIPRIRAKAIDERIRPEPQEGRFPRLIRLFEPRKCLVFVTESNVNQDNVEGGHVLPLHNRPDLLQHLERPTGIARTRTGIAEPSQRPRVVRMGRRGELLGTR